MKNSEENKNKAGRKKLPEGERKVTLIIYPKQKDIDKHGGTEQARNIALKAVEN